VIRALCRNPFKISNLSEAGDTQIMEELLERVVNFMQKAAGLKDDPSLCQEGDKTPLLLNAQDAGTVMRFLTAFLAASPGHYLLTGTDRMKQRPVSELVDALITLGARIDYIEKEGYPPIRIVGGQLQGGTVDINASHSSQFLTAILLIAPAMLKDLRLITRDNVASEPYVDMTIRLLEHFGIEVRIIPRGLVIKAQEYQPHDITVETDWSSASFWYEMAALADNGELILEGLHEKSIQGDSILPHLFDKLGVKTIFLHDGIKIVKTHRTVENFEFNFGNYPDIALPLSVVCASMNIPAKISGIKNLELKESPRISVLCNVLVKMNFSVNMEDNDTLVIHSCNQDINHSISINTMNDHRIAMSFAPLAVKFGSIRLQNPEVVRKSYPMFWTEMERIGFLLSYR
jgi:3-phosphoshikimate 1-carboxyvinyltransferase